MAKTILKETQLSPNWASDVDPDVVDLENEGEDEEETKETVLDMTITVAEKRNIKMKKSDVIRLVNEEIKSFRFRGDDPKFHYGRMMPQTFWLVTRPGKFSEITDIVFETDWAGYYRQIQGGLTLEEIYGFYGDEEEATKVAKRLLSINVQLK